MKAVWRIAACLVVVAGLAGVVKGQAAAAKEPASPAVLLENGIYTEQTVGDLVAAIRIYKEVLADAAASVDQKAQAQFRLGMCYMKQRNSAEAEKAFRLLISGYPEQKELVEAAKVRLSRLTVPNPAALMPPDMVLYLEMGQPGNQVEKIVNMLKGTPLANPLEAIRGGQPATQPSRRSGEKTPADIIAALLNPSMLAEFKKVRGMAVGLSDVPMGPRVPRFVAVLYPGESDALRGILMAALLMVGVEGEPLEGMKTIAFETGACCGYDETVMIVANSREQLAWSVKQYKGLTSEPSLATANKSFAALTDAKARSADALTVWLSPAGVYGWPLQAFKSNRRPVPQQLLAVQQLADLEHMEGAVLRLVIDEKSPYLEGKLAFLPGAKCLPYDLLRTPPLSREGFAGVSAEAVALLSFALSGAEHDARAADQAREAVRQFTGLDIGREIFANIEQVNLFTVEPTEATAANIFGRMTSPLLPCLGVAITSHDPAQTRLVLDRLLSAAEAVASLSGGESGSGERQPGRYCLMKVRGRPVYVYLLQRGRTTFLGLEPAVLEAAASAPAGKSALTAGPLHGGLVNLPAGTSKLLAVNLGGAAKLAIAHLQRMMPAQARTQPSAVKRLAAMNELAEALSKTYLRLYTVEDPQLLTVRLELLDIPPLGELFPLVMRIQSGR